MSKKRSFVLRLSEDKMKALEKWAGDEFRSTNGQIEWIITKALKDSKRLKQNDSSNGNEDYYTVMENEKSSVEILKDIAKREGWECNIIEETLNARYGHRSRHVIIRNYNVKNSYFISAQSTNFDKYRLYSGIFFPVSGYDNYKLLIRKRDPLDKLSFRKNRLRFKVGNSSFDSKVYIETNNDIETHKLLSSSKIQLEIIEYLHSADLLFIGFNEINPAFNKDLEGKKNLSVFMSMTWMLDKKMIDSAFKLGELLRSKFNLNK